MLASVASGVAASEVGQVVAATISRLDEVVDLISSKLVAEVADAPNRGAPRCRGLEARPYEGGSITATALRAVAPDQLMRVAVMDAMRTIAELPSGELQAIAPSLEERDDFYENYRRGARRPRRGAPLTDADLQHVAKAYREAIR
jgi:hypothetical protein